MARRRQTESDLIHTNISFSQVDFWLLLCVVLLLGIGTMMIFSASTPSASTKTSDSTAYDVLKQQILFTGVGVIILFVTSMVDYKLLARFSLLLFLLSTALMLLVLTPLGRTVNNARRWLNLGILFQPSEILKLAVVFFLAWTLSRPGLRDKAIKPWAILIYILPIGLNIVLLVLQPHISCVVIILAIAASMMFAGKVKWYTFAVTILLLAAIGALAFLYFKTHDELSFEYIVNRITAHGDDAAANEKDTYQATQSLYAIGSGGLFGRGFGRSVQKYLYLPEPYNDFIFSILAEELGLVGVLLVITLFLVLILRGFKVSSKAPDLCGSLLAFGIITNIAVQVVLNLAVVSKLMPVTGISLPFFSYGGTSLWIMMASMGIVLNISKQSRYSKF